MCVAPKGASCPTCGGAAIKIRLQRLTRQPRAHGSTLMMVNAVGGAVNMQVSGVAAHSSAFAPVSDGRAGRVRPLAVGSRRAHFDSPGTRPAPGG